MTNVMDYYGQAEISNPFYAEYLELGGKPGVAGFMTYCMELNKIMNDGKSIHF